MRNSAAFNVGGSWRDAQIKTAKIRDSATQEGVREADNGQFIDHARLKAKWEKKLAAAVDKAR